MERIEYIPLPHEIIFNNVKSNRDETKIDFNHNGFASQNQRHWQHCIAANVHIHITFFSQHFFLYLFSVESKRLNICKFEDALHRILLMTIKLRIFILIDIQNDRTHTSGRCSSAFFSLFIRMDAVALKRFAKWRNKDIWHNNAKLKRNPLVISEWTTFATLIYGE